MRSLMICKMKLTKIIMNLMNRTIRTTTKIKTLKVIINTIMISKIVLKEIEKV